MFELKDKKITYSKAYVIKRKIKLRGKFKHLAYILDKKN
jgi:hypothetical protein